MAIINVNEGPKMLNKDTPLPKGSYACQCIEEEFDTSSKGNKYMKRKWQIRSPETVRIGDSDYVIAGKVVEQAPIMIEYAEDPTGAQTRTALDFFCREAAILGIEADPAAFDTDNPPLACKGLVADCILTADRYIQRNQLTEEEKAAGKTEGSPILDPATNKPKVNYTIKFKEVVGLNTQVSAIPQAF